MAKYCGNCGSALNETASFCGGCGTRLATEAPAPSATVAPDAGFTTVPSFAPGPPAQNAGSAPNYSTPNYPASGYTSVLGAPSQYVQTPAPAPVAYMPSPPSIAPARSNTLLKLVIALVIIIFAGSALAVGGLWWAAQKIKAKAHAVAAQVMGEAAPGSTLNAGDEAPGGFTGDPCRFLSKVEVSRAVGLPVLRAEAQDGGCSYIAKGDPAEVTAKHMSAMLAGMGAGAEAQQMAQKFAGGLFAQQEATDKGLSAEAATKEIPVLTLAFTAGHAATEMKLNRGAMAHIVATTPEGSVQNPTSPGGDLAGIGDEAYSAAGSMIMLRKGNVVVRMMYVSCPCNTDNIKPLARMLASRL